MGNEIAELKEMRLEIAGSTLQLLYELNGHTEHSVRDMKNKANKKQMPLCFTNDRKLYFRLQIPK